MKRFYTMVLTFSFVALALMLVSATPSAQAAPPANPFAGSWAGIYELYIEGNLVYVGTGEWTISAQGVLLGLHDPGTPDEGVLLGKVWPNGRTFINNPQGGGFPGAVPTPGDSWINADGQMEGIYTQVGQGAIVIVVVMDPV